MDESSKSDEEKRNEDEDENEEEDEKIFDANWYSEDGAVSDSC